VPVLLKASIGTAEAVPFQKKLSFE